MAAATPTSVKLANVDVPLPPGETVYHGVDMTKAKKNPRECLRELLTNAALSPSFFAVPAKKPPSDCLAASDSKRLAFLAQPEVQISIAALGDAAPPAGNGLQQSLVGVRGWAATETATKEPHLHLLYEHNQTDGIPPYAEKNTPGWAVWERFVITKMWPAQKELWTRQERNREERAKKAEKALDELVAHLEVAREELPQLASTSTAPVAPVVEPPLPLDLPLPPPNPPDDRGTKRPREEEDASVDMMFKIDDLLQELRRDTDTQEEMCQLLGNEEPAADDDEAAFPQLEQAPEPDDPFALGDDAYRSMAGSTGEAAAGAYRSLAAEPARYRSLGDSAVEVPQTAAAPAAPAAPKLRSLLSKVEALLQRAPGAPSLVKVRDSVRALLEGRGAQE